MVSKLVFPKGYVAFSTVWRDCRDQQPARKCQSTLQHISEEWVPHSHLAEA
jgi:hypothetical protein